MLADTESVHVTRLASLLLNRASTSHSHHKFTFVPRPITTMGKGRRGWLWWDHLSAAPLPVAPTLPPGAVARQRRRPHAPQPGRCRPTPHHCAVSATPGPPLAAPTPLGPPPSHPPAEFFCPARRSSRPSTPECRTLIPHRPGVHPADFPPPEPLLRPSVTVVRPLR
jgi:hypothetical protein